jgi:SAM-dependent methyltransferase
MHSVMCRLKPDNHSLTVVAQNQRFRAARVSKRYGGHYTRALIWFFLLLHSVAWAQGVHPVTGRRYAAVMGIGGADWLVRPEREAEEQPDAALDAIGIVKGSTVADVGAGAGYFTWRLAERVGPAGKVYANDIEPRMLQLLRANMQQRGIGNVEPVVGAVDDPRLPRNAIDLVLMVDVYHEFSEPQAMLRKMRESLKSDGRLVLIEYRGEDPSVPIRPEHKMTIEQVKAEVGPEGFMLDRIIDKLPRQHILIFRKKNP